MLNIVKQFQNRLKQSFQIKHAGKNILHTYFKLKIAVTNTYFTNKIYDICELKKDRHVKQYVCSIKC